MKHKTYYSLIQRTGKMSGFPQWAPQWGAWDLQHVKDEMKVYREGGIPAKNLKIIATNGGTTAEIDLAIASL